MKILFLGDSITEGVGASEPSKKYVEVAKQMLGCDARNYGISGTRIARQKIYGSTTAFDWDFQQRAMIMDKDADLVFVFGGTNDFGHGNSEFGECNSTDPYTYHGGINNLCDYLISTYTKERLCFLLPLRRCDETNERGLNLVEYVDILRTELAKRGINYIDLYKNGLAQPASRTPDEYFADGLHPNDKGHAYLAGKVAEYVKEYFAK